MDGEKSPKEEHKARKISNRFSLKTALKSLGPGLITGASDDDPSGIATYSQAGASFGLGMLWMALILYPMMAVIQEMCARIGLVEGDGLAFVMKKNIQRK
ncbi:MAG TPA: divalent metal cation transporter [Nitrososphaeraceae archaeon]